jgi:hypothetical protein
MHAALLVGHLGVTLSAICCPLVTRKLEGNLPRLLDTLGFDFTARYSMWQLGGMATGEGGWDYLMAVTFDAFILVTPLLRPLSLLAVLLAPLPLDVARGLFRASRYVSFYYALEVMIVVVPLIQVTMGPLTAGLLTPATFPLCTQLQEAFGQKHCFGYTVEIASGYYLLFGAVAMHALCGFDGSPTHKFLHRRLFPEMPPPPPTNPCPSVKKKGEGGL